MEAQDFESWRDFESFATTVRERSRYVLSDDCKRFVDAVRYTALRRMRTLDEGTSFWRAQIHHELQAVTGAEEPEFGPTHLYDRFVPALPERMMPKKDQATEGRVNPKGIPCLYLASTKETAMSEMRPWMDTVLTVAEFKLKQSVIVIDVTQPEPSGVPRWEMEPEECAWQEIGEAFSEPVSRSDEVADYAPTQYLAEVFKDALFGGILYRSRVAKDGINLALFNPDDAMVTECSLFEVSSIEFKFAECLRFK